MMHLKADDEHHGMGIDSLVHRVKSGTWIAGLRASRNLDRVTEGHAHHTKRESMHTWTSTLAPKCKPSSSDKAASITTPTYSAFFKQAISTDAVTFLNGTQPAKAVRKR